MSHGPHRPRHKVVDNCRQCDNERRREREWSKKRYQAWKRDHPTFRKATKQEEYVNLWSEFEILRSRVLKLEEAVLQLTTEGNK